MQKTQWENNSKERSPMQWPRVVHALHWDQFNRWQQTSIEQSSFRCDHYQIYQSQKIFSYCLYINHFNYGLTTFTVDLHSLGVEVNIAYLGLIYFIVDCFCKSQMCGIVPETQFFSCLCEISFFVFLLHSFEYDLISVKTSNKTCKWMLY